MRYNPLGKTGLYVSELCLGTMTFGGGGFWQAIGELGQQGGRGADRHRARRAASTSSTPPTSTPRARASGCVGAALKALARPREQVVVATKVRGRVGPGVNQVGLSRGHILASIDASLRRLGLDHVDLYQIHGFDPATPIEETVRALDDVVRSGKARYVGFSNLPAWVASKALTFADANGLARFQSAQVYYSIAGRDIEREIAPLCQAEARGDPAVEPARRRPAVGQVRSRQEGPRGRAARVLRFPARQPGAPAARARGAAQGRRGDRRVRRARRARLAAHEAVRDQHHHRREEARAARRQPRRRRAAPVARAREAARRGERAAARVPGLDGRVPERARSARRRAACPPKRRSARWPTASSRQATRRRRLAVCLTDCPC